MNSIFNEGNLRLDFSSCNAIQPVERFDNRHTNAYGLMPVDFVMETADTLFFIEVKDFQNPNATTERREEDYKMLTISDRQSIFTLKMGQKIKDSLLREYAMGEKFTKKITYLLLLNFDGLGERERGLLKEKISGHIPTGLNSDRFGSFTKISFSLVDRTQAEETFAIICAEN